MKIFKMSLVALTAIFALSTGIVNAAPSSDCGADDVKPINTHGSAKATNKDA